MVKVLAAVLFILINIEPCPAKVLVAKINGIINPPMAGYITYAIKKAEEQNSKLIITIDTPGGLDTSMRKIVSRMLNTNVDIITFTYPKGARAASAGLFILIAGKKAAMAPGTNAGAAHPVTFGVKSDKILLKKATNDAIAFIKSIAKLRGRNHKPLILAITKSKSYTAEEALKKGIIDLIATDIKDLLSKLKLKETTQEIPMPLKYKILYTISHPNIAYTLAVLGFYGILFELSNPGLIFPGVAGIIFILTALYSLHVLPISYAGIAFMILSFILFILELKIVSHGILGAGGVISLIIGSLMLFDTPSKALKPSIYLIVITSIITAVLFLIIAGFAIKSQIKKPVSGKEGMIGEIGIAKTDITPEGGWVFVHGERWQAISDTLIKEGEKVRVISVSGLKLKVEKLQY